MKKLYTFYNTLNIFKEKGLLSHITITANEKRFDLNTKWHHHFLCEKCGLIYDLEINCPHSDEEMMCGHLIKERHGYFRGICKECLEK